VGPRGVKERLMSLTVPHTPNTPPPASRRRAHLSIARAARHQLAQLAAFWAKVRNDWIFHLSSLVAYNLLLATFPVVLVLLAVAGLFLGQLSPGAYAQLQASVNHVIPLGGGALTAAAYHLARNAGNLLIIGVAGSIYGGSRLFVVLENCCSIIFRLRGRNFLYQNIVAISMFLLFAVLVPIISLASLIPAAVTAAAGLLAHIPSVLLGIQLLGVLISFAFAVLFFALIYLVVPNRPLRDAHIWPGTLVAAALLVIFQVLFSLFGTLVANLADLGWDTGFLFILLCFFYAFAFIMLLGAEINSWFSGQRQALGDLAFLLHAVQAHDSTTTAACPTASLPTEDGTTKAPLPCAPPSP
jgi:membrane protein